MPAAPVMSPLAAVKVPVPRPSMLMPSLALLVELDVVEGERGAGGAGDVDGWSAGGADVVGAGSVHGDGAGVSRQERRRGATDVVVSDKSAPVPSSERQRAGGRREADAAGRRAGDGDVVDRAGTRSSSWLLPRRGRWRPRS